MYVTPTDASARALLQRDAVGPITMLNLVRFHDIADYSNAPPMFASSNVQITGEEAYQLYLQGIKPMLDATGGEILFHSDAGPWFIGPENEYWDRAIIVRQKSIADFLAFAKNPEAARIGHHRTAALRDSRLLPMTPR